MENNEQKDIPMPPLQEETADNHEEVQEEVVESQSNEEIQEQPEELPEQQIETKAQANFRTLRQEKERLELENKEAMRKLAEYENSKNKQPQEEEDLDINLNDDDLFEGKHYKKLAKKLKKQEEVLKQYQQQVNLTSTEARLKAQYSDFDQVVSEVNIKALQNQEPELAATIASNNDIYSKAVAAYKMIKRLGIHVEDNYTLDKQLAQQNAKKPKPLASVSPQQGDTPLSKANAFANGLTPELQKQLLREMNEASKNY